jgi:4,4'-diaponeurosporenoate glycosyltransferase
LDFPGIVLSVASGLCGFVAFWRIRTVPGTERIPSGPRVAVSFIIPARNEERNLPGLLDSLLGQLGPEDEIIVVDDHSSDGTAAVAAARNRVTVVPAPDHEDMKNGKSLACSIGARAARRPHLLFLDADVILRPGALERIAGCYPGRGHVWSVQPFHRIRKLYENLSLFFNIISVMGSNSFSLLSRAGKPTGTFGPLLLCHRDDYDAVGGHKAVSEDVLEDIALGKRFIRNGIAVTAFAGQGAVDFRMYPEGLAQLCGGWAKNFSLGAVSIHPLLFLLITLWVTGTVVSALHLFFFPPLQPDWIVSACFYLFFVFQAAFFSRRIGSFSPAALLLYPVPLLFFILLFLFSAFSSFILRRVVWKDRTIRVRRKRPS